MNSYGTVLRADQPFDSNGPATVSKDDISPKQEAQSTAVRSKILRYLLPAMALLFVSAIIGFNSSQQSPYSSSAGSGDIFEQEASNEVVSKTKSEKSKPNFVFFLIDDLPWNGINFENEFDLDFVTPRIKRLVQEDGIVIERYYAQELCTPSRASLMTGRYPASIARQYNEIAIEQVDGLDLSEQLLPQVLKEYGYTNYMLGKWNLGNSDPRYLPTSRGFDQFLGYMGGGINPFSKTTAEDNVDYIDFMYSDKECYNLYDGQDFNNYTTYIFRDKAIDAINAHDFDMSPMFMYLAFHAVHSPLGGGDLKVNIDADDVGDHLYSLIEETVTDTGRQAIAAVLNVVDQTVNEVYEAMVGRGQAGNTYFIVTSDNGGCPDSGGFNGPLRGCKGSLYEGGTRVPAMMFGKVLPEEVRGSVYHGLMHTSDWLPTLLQLADITDYDPSSKDKAFDGVSQAAAMLDSRTDHYPRTSMLYNVYYHVSYMDFDLDTYTSAAVRNDRYKLIHSYADSEVAGWHAYNSTDTSMTGKCDPQNVMIGTKFKKQLYDLNKDPYETTNLYNDQNYIIIRKELTAMLLEFAEGSTNMHSPDLSEGVGSFFSKHAGFVQPFVDKKGELDTKLQRCSKSTVFRR